VSPNSVLRKIALLSLCRPALRFRAAGQGGRGAHDVFVGCGVPPGTSVDDVVLGSAMDSIIALPAGCRRLPGLQVCLCLLYTDDIHEMTSMPAPPTRRSSVGCRGRVPLRPCCHDQHAGYHRRRSYHRQLPKAIGRNRSFTPLPK
jgi:hypothetical protein